MSQDAPDWVVRSTSFVMHRASAWLSDALARDLAGALGGGAFPCDRTAPSAGSDADVPACFQRRLRPSKRGKKLEANYSLLVRPAPQKVEGSDGITDRVEFEGSGTEPCNMLEGCWELQAMEHACCRATLTIRMPTRTGAAPAAAPAPGATGIVRTILDRASPPTPTGRVSPLDLPPGSSSLLLSQDRAVLLLNDLMSSVPRLAALFDRSSEVDASALAALSDHFLEAPSVNTSEETDLVERAKGYMEKHWKVLPGTIADPVQYARGRGESTHSRPPRHALPNSPLPPPPLLTPVVAAQVLPRLR